MIGKFLKKNILLEILFAIFLAAFFGARGDMATQMIFAWIYDNPRWIPFLVTCIILLVYIVYLIRKYFIVKESYNLNAVKYMSLYKMIILMDNVREILNNPKPLHIHKSWWYSIFPPLITNLRPENKDDIYYLLNKLDTFNSSIREEIKDNKYKILYNEYFYKIECEVKALNMSGENLAWTEKGKLE